MFLAKLALDKLALSQNIVKPIEIIQDRNNLVKQIENIEDRNNF